MLASRRLHGQVRAPAPRQVYTRRPNWLAPTSALNCGYRVRYCGHPHCSTTRSKTAVNRTALNRRVGRTSCSLHPTGCTGHYTRDNPLRRPVCGLEPALCI